MKPKKKNKIDMQTCAHETERKTKNVGKMCVIKYSTNPPMIYTLYDYLDTINVLKINFNENFVIIIEPALARIVLLVGKSTLYR